MHRGPEEEEKATHHFPSNPTNMYKRQLLSSCIPLATSLLLLLPVAPYLPSPATSFPFSLPQDAPRKQPKKLPVGSAQFQFNKGMWVTIAAPRFLQNFSSLINSVFGIDCSFLV